MDPNNIQDVIKLDVLDEMWGDNLTKIEDYNRKTWLLVVDGGNSSIK